MRIKARRAFFRKALWQAGIGTAFFGALYALQMPFREYPGVEYNNFPLPADFQEETEWVFARLMYPSAPTARIVRRYRMGGSDWTHGLTSWTQDYPRADRHFAEEIRRLTRIHVRSVEQPVSLDDGDDVDNWPWLYAVQVGEWKLTDAQAAKLREYLLRGGFLMVDDFHGDQPYHGVFSEWQVFLASMKKVFPDREIIDLADNDPIFHTIYDLSDRFQVPGWGSARRGITYEAGTTGMTPHWRAILDDRGRVMVAICHNMDLGDAWEWSDDARYPEKYASLAYRIAMNYFTYDLTH